MNNRVRLWITALKLAAAAVVSVLLFILTLNAIKNPVTGSTRSYTADFTDVAGLHPNADVRIRGVQVGKVQSIELNRQRGVSLATVTFSLEKKYQLTTNTTLAVKYQNLTGVRYVDMSVPPDAGKPTIHLPVTMTKPSFDITQLFNGLQPVLTTMSPDEINRFTQNAITLLQGDGGGLAPMLDSVQKLANYATDRQQVISTLVANLSRISDTLGGKSPQVIDFLHDLGFSIGRALSVLDEFRKTAFFGPQFMQPIDKLLIELGLSPELDVDRLISSVFSSAGSLAQTFRLLPVALEGLQAPQLQAGGPASAKCSNGIAPLPPAVKVFLNGSKVVICNAH
ncbi:MCE family protein [Nocardia nova]|uniref:MCE family protein n=1 Tax=Nocardia nova TaxID=37330 RepID=UPI0025B03CA2|nr:MCE family protein [Nocardia nova]MDN2495453.1 MCE family protein [Nocardia nova]